MKTVIVQSVGLPVYSTGMGLYRHAATGDLMLVIRVIRTDYRGFTCQVFDSVTERIIDDCWVPYGHLVKVDL